ncbi:Asp23/Gls24 family envelope stress response protein [Rhabdothermincola salaria]|uniref:Asp23/Gls24 family envelope stress response protein n=1 Tax=Rhabdothermincola salaria TaxID=2903142 RepID=UPI001E62753B|nr:Asp23/Gls24 family envelope stress response protein [Rhabdothermincola salaria]MCD9623954.1 Asp23/Gls24 family envelope stress response protein [Rhabdothermincola salaria]
MSDTATQNQPASKPGNSGNSGSLARLETDKGTTSISEDVVGKIASIAAREVEGVDSLGGALSGALGSVVGRIRGDEHKQSGVGVEVGTRQAAVDISMTVKYPASIMDVTGAVRQNVIDRIEGMTGLEVVEVNIAVNDLAFSGGDQDQNSGRVE